MAQYDDDDDDISIAKSVLLKQRNDQSLKNIIVSDKNGPLLWNVQHKNIG